MTTPPPPPPPSGPPTGFPPPPPPPLGVPVMMVSAPAKQSHKLLITLLCCGGLFAVFVVIVALADTPKNGTTSIAGPPSTLASVSTAGAPAAAAAPSTAAPTTAAPDHTPAPEDFEIEVIELKRSCFGSAGCNITYEIKPTYTGALSSGSKSWTVIYEIRGGEDVKTDNFTMRGDGQASSKSSQNYISTPTNPTLTAVVTRVV